MTSLPWAEGVVGVNVGYAKGMRRIRERVAISRTFGVRQTARCAAAVVATRLASRWEHLVAPNGQPLRMSMAAGDWGALHEIYGADEYALPASAEQLPVRTVLDFGANAGLASLYFGMKYSDARVLAFEPIPAIHARLRRNTSTMPNVECFPHAVCASDRRLVFNVAGMSSTSLDSGSSGETVEVQGVDIFEQLSHVGAEGPFLLKLDIEGGEYELFADPRIDDLLALTNIVFFEAHRFGPESDERFPAVYETLAHHFPHVKLLRAFPGWAAVYLAHR